jgi:hypothetical protein
VKEYSDVPKGKWYYTQATYLYSLGLLDDGPNFQGEYYAIRGVLLTWMVNAQEWLNNNPAGGGSSGI